MVGAKQNAGDENYVKINDSQVMGVTMFICSVWRIDFTKDTDVARVPERYYICEYETEKLRTIPRAGKYRRFGVEGSEQ
jgi:hypothetical protein